ncbi:hypothetical protein B0H34DRAFT_114928 [Crassisporium funariophilum]|nr:hypothetical protein B0H34DRAFT_114928 [Crassisporium funariophilum]
MRVAAAACPYPIQCHPHPHHQPHPQTHTGTRLLFADDLFPDPVGALHLARKCGGTLLSISGAALYRLSCIDPTSDWDALHTEPRRSSVESQQRLNAGLRSARWGVLGAVGWRALVALQDFLRACTLKLLRIPNRCSPMCDEGMREAWGAVVQRALVGRDLLFALEEGIEGFDGLVGRGSVCAACAGSAREVARKMRERIWAELWVVLGIDPEVKFEDA